MISLEKINELESASASVAFNPVVGKQKLNTLIAEILCDIENDSLAANVLLETLLEKNVSNECITQIFNFTKEHVKDNENLFKWACAFRHPEIIQLFFDNLNIKPEEPAINASIINFKLENLICLEMLGFDIYKEKYFSQAIARSYQNRKINIIHYYIKNLNKFSTNEISVYSLKQLSEHDFVLDNAFKIGSIKMIDWFLKEPILKEAFEKQMEKNVSGWLYSCITQKTPQLFLKLLNLSDKYPTILKNFKKIENDLLVGAFRENKIQNILCLLNIDKYLYKEINSSNNISQTTNKKYNIKAPKINAQCLEYFIIDDKLNNLKMFLEGKKFQKYLDKKIDYEYLLTKAIEEDKLEIFDYLSQLEKNPLNLIKEDQKTEENKIEFLKLIINTMKYDIEENNPHPWMTYMIIEKNTPLTMELEEIIKELDGAEKIIQQFKLKELNKNLSSNLDNNSKKAKGLKI